MAQGKVFRVVIGGKGYDLMNAFGKASVADWAALIGATGRNPFTVGKGIQLLDKLRDADPMEALAGPTGAVFTETVGDLVFLARRIEHERSPADPGRPITPAESFETTPLFDALGAWSEALTAQQADGEGEVDDADPTSAPTATDRGDGGQPPDNRTP